MVPGGEAETLVGKTGHLPPRQRPKRLPKESYPEPPLLRAVLTYMGYAILYVMGHINDFLRKVGLRTEGYTEQYQNDDLFKMGLDFERFFTRNMYRRIRDAWNRPIASTPGAYFDIVDRVSDDNNWTFRHTGTTTPCLNLGSYNYLGFAESTGPCADASMEATYKYGAGCPAVRKNFGLLDIHKELEQLIARFVGKPAAIVFGMGFATNSMNIPALVGKGSLIISDELNHASLITGARLSGSSIKTFKHNDMRSLESVLRQSIIKGQPRTHRPWKKILIMVEGVYSMEGSVSKLEEVVALKKKYKAPVIFSESDQFPMTCSHATESGQ